MAKKYLVTLSVRKKIITLLMLKGKRIQALRQSCLC
jgi:hypothetical protein